MNKAQERCKNDKEKILIEIQNTIIEIKNSKQRFNIRLDASEE